MMPTLKQLAKTLKVQQQRVAAEMRNGNLNDFIEQHIKLLNDPELYSIDSVYKKALMLKDENGKALGFDQSSGVLGYGLKVITSNHQEKLIPHRYEDVSIGDIVQDRITKDKFLVLYVDETLLVYVSIEKTASDAINLTQSVGNRYYNVRFKKL